MVKYNSKYSDTYVIKDVAKGRKYDAAISTKFEFIIWEIEKKTLKDIFDNFLNSNKYLDYLDFACGTGRILCYMKNELKLYNVTGLDISAEMLSEAKKKCEGNFIEGNMVENNNLLKNKKFDLITSFRLFLNLENENSMIILNELKYYLKKDGYLIINNHMNRYSILGLVAFLLKKLGMPSKIEAKKNQRGIINTASELEFKKILKEAGYKVEKVYRFQLFPGYKNFVIFPKEISVPIEIFISKIPILNLFCKDQVYVCQKYE